MTSQLKVDNLTGRVTAGSINVTSEGSSVTTNLQQGLLKAFMDLDGTSTIALLDSFNLSGTTDNGTGDYSVAFSNIFNSESYGWGGNGEFPYDNYWGRGPWCVARNQTTSSTQIAGGYFGTSGKEDLEHVRVGFFGDLA